MVRLVGLHFHRAQRIDGAMAEAGHEQPNLALGLAVRGGMLGLVPLQVRLQEVADRGQPGKNANAMGQFRFFRCSYALSFAWADATNGDAASLTAFPPVEVRGAIPPEDCDLDHCLEP